MSEIKLLAIDLAKRVFQLHGTDASGAKVLERRLMRDQVEPFVAALPACEIAMEACGSAHDWGRRFAALGHRVRLLPPPEVARLVDRRKKNDWRDARAIALAARLEHVRPVPLKSAAAQAEQFEHRARAQLIKARTAFINLLRAMLLEFGIAVPKGPQTLKRQQPALMASERFQAIPLSSQAMAADLYARIGELDAAVAAADRRIVALVKQRPAARLLLTIPGIGPVNASAFPAAIPDIGAYANGRAFAAALGLVPKQDSSGERVVLGAITKRGNRYLRTLLVHAGRALLVKAMRTETPRDGLLAWAKALRRRMPWNRAAVALANKLARIVWAVLAFNQPYRPRPV
ncbi:MAG: IS110 family transposase [Burkholderiales bacterium]